MQIHGRYKKHSGLLKTNLISVNINDINISLFIGCLVKTRNYSILSLAFIASSFRVTEENLVFETVQSGPYSSFECFHCSLRN